MPRGKPGSGVRPGVNAYYALSREKRRKLGPYTPKLGKTLLKNMAQKPKPKKKVVKKKVTKPELPPMKAPGA